MNESKYVVERSWNCIHTIEQSQTNAERKKKNNNRITQPKRTKKIGKITQLD